MSQQTNSPSNNSSININSTLNVRKRIFSPLNRSELVDKSLVIQLNNKTNRNSLKYGIINAMILCFLMVDISNRCPFSYSKWFYVEYAVASILAVSVLYQFGRYFYFVFSFEPLKGTVDQKRLLQFNDAGMQKRLFNTFFNDFNGFLYCCLIDSSFVIDQTPNRKTNISTANAANVTLLSWHSSMNDCKYFGHLILSITKLDAIISFPKLKANRSIYGRASGGSPHQQNQSSSFNQNWNSFQNASLNSTPGGIATATTISANTSERFSSPYQKYAKNEIITDENSWQNYLKDGQQESMKNFIDIDTVDAASSSTAAADRQAMNSFWNYCNNAANVLKNSLYQMAPTASSQSTPVVGGSSSTTTTGSSAPASKDELGIFGNTDINGHSDEIKKICSLGHLTQFVYNIRTWIACTVLHRLDTEITNTNHAFEARGLSDIKIGSVGLDRLKKTADNQQLIAMYAPMLPILVPFLDMSTNQEYLVQRIKDLAKGSVLAKYRWNSGGSYNGLNWDEHLPTDSAVRFNIYITLMCYVIDFMVSMFVADNIPFILCIFG